MNYLLNPMFVVKILKSYFFDVNRIWELNQKSMADFQEKKIKEIIKYAYNSVPFYHQKYQEANILPEDIQSVEDFNKIPFVTKKDFQNASSVDLLPGPIKKQGMITTTSGTKGKPLSIYITLFDVVQGLFGYLRPFREYGIDWRKHNIAFILDLRQDSVERKYLNEGIFPSFKPFISFDNIRVFSLRQDAEELITELDKFQPDFIGGYTGKLTHLALLKENGYGQNVNPIAMGSTGEPLDEHVKALVEEAFDTKCYNTYGATEPGPVAFECRKRNIHIDSDLIYCEFFKNGKHTVGEEPGNIVITKLFGKGTPIIRYTGMNDIVAPSTEICSCGIKHRLIKKIYGRDNWYLIFPGGIIMLPSGISEIFGKIVYEYRIRMIKGIQMIQNDFKELHVNLIINFAIKEKIPVKNLIKIIKDEFYEKIGSDTDVNIIVKEVKKFDQEGYIKSTLNKDEFEINKYL